MTLVETTIRSPETKDGDDDNDTGNWCQDADNQVRIEVQQRLL